MANITLTLQINLQVSNQSQANKQSRVKKKHLILSLKTSRHPREHRYVKKCYTCSMDRYYTKNIFERELWQLVTVLHLRWMIIPGCVQLL